jgi:hypothetical protein
MFSVGDIIQKNQDLSQRFIILSIRTEDGGNWHDGFSICEIATIIPIDSSEESSEYMLSFHQYENDPQVYAILCDDSKKNINSE